jgi:hypothetical protein
MSENASTTELTSHYTAQVTADLERNTKEQERISGEIALLSQQLAALQHDHIVLVNIHQAIGTIAPTPAPTVKTKPSGSPAVPSPRKKATPKTATSKQTRPKKTAPKAPATAAATATPAPADKAEASKPPSPPWSTWSAATSPSTANPVRRQRSPQPSVRPTPHARSRRPGCA